MVLISNLRARIPGVVVGVVGVVEMVVRPTG
jgi:hypothetical protein